jgi:excinuclease ABC subunit B
MLAREDESTEELLKTWQKAGSEKKKAPVPGLGREAGKHASELAGLPSQDLADLVQQLTEQMHSAAAELQFELAARLRDEISELKKELRQMVEAGAR